MTICCLKYNCWVLTPVPHRVASKRHVNTCCVHITNKNWVTNDIMTGKINITVKMLCSTIHQPEFTCSVLGVRAHCYVGGVCVCVCVQGSRGPGRERGVHLREDGAWLHPAAGALLAVRGHQRASHLGLSMQPVQGTGKLFPPAISCNIYNWSNWWCCRSVYLLLTCIYYMTLHPGIPRVFASEPTCAPTDHKLKNSFCGRQIQGDLLVLIRI